MSVSVVTTILALFTVMACGWKNVPCVMMPCASALTAAVLADDFARLNVYVFVPPVVPTLYTNFVPDAIVYTSSYASLYTLYVLTA